MNEGKKKRGDFWLMFALYLGMFLMTIAFAGVVLMLVGGM